MGEYKQAELISTEERASHGIGLTKHFIRDPLLQVPDTLHCSFVTMQLELEIIQKKAFTSMHCIEINCLVYEGVYTKLLAVL